MWTISDDVPTQIEKLMNHPDMKDPIKRATLIDSIKSNKYLWNPDTIIIIPKYFIDGSAKVNDTSDKSKVVGWMIEIGFPRNTYLASYLASRGELEMLKWIRKHNCPWDEETFYEAVCSGHKEMITWLKSQGCPWNETTCTAAAIHGRLDILKYLRANGCPWSKETSLSAAEHGHVPVLEWLICNGCPWDPYDCCLYAAKRGHGHVLEWMKNHGWDWESNKDILVALSPKCGSTSGLGIVSGLGKVSGPGKKVCSSDTLAVTNKANGLIIGSVMKCKGGSSCLNKYLVTLTTLLLFIVIII